MSALRLRRVPLGSVESGGTCIVDGCSRKGRDVIEILGVPFQSPLEGKELLCLPCSRAWRRLWREMNGEKHEADTIKHLTTIKDFQEHPEDRELRTARADAIDALREAGFSSEEVGYARALIQQGVEPDRVFEQMVWGWPAEAVAA